MSPVIIVGAGISGLSAAFWLSRAGVDVTVLEADGVPGGTMQTIRDGGWLIEAGPNSALETTPLFGAMFENLGIAGERVYAGATGNKRYILRDGTLHPLPMSPVSFLRSRLWSTAGKLRLLKEPFVGRGRKEESVAAFVERRLGHEFLDYAINPFVAGVYAGDPAALSVRHAFPKLYALEERYGGLIRGMIGGARERKRRAEKAKDRAKMFSFASGMQTFPDAVGRMLGSRLRLSTPVRCVSRRGSNGAPTWRVEFNSGGEGSALDAQALILAVPAHAAGLLLDNITEDAQGAFSRIYYPPVAQVFLGFRTADIPRPLDGFGYLVPAKERRSILGTLWSSALFPGRAPEGHAAMTTFVGGSRQPELVGYEDNRLTGTVVNDLRSIMGITADPVYQRVIRWERAIPQYMMGYGDVLEGLANLESRSPGLFLLGNYRGGIAVGDCVMSGDRVAQRVLEYLQKS